MRLRDKLQLASIVLWVAFLMAFAAMVFTSVVMGVPPVRVIHATVVATIFTLVFLACLDAALYTCRSGNKTPAQRQHGDRPPPQQDW